MIRKNFRRPLAVAGAVSAALTIGLFAASPAMAATASMAPGNATLASGQSRAIGAAWGDKAPYSVTFHCHVTGCSDFVSSSTSTSSLGRTVGVATCTGLVATHTLSVTDATHGGASASETTTWTKGKAC
ncbi:hypothetical protein [Curtobacterium sp. MCBD17_040]|uniref:hypothetical protein n=1 Tax=Curtobacterium sp. MCBD17_040 TaxID=2175674 RepID=UPI0011B45D5D|nr:hypothetical protein [Curtobacterium sp. MCBD17_040]WIB65665.1 hypothetical protein DEI94_16220 [Curtobacterium sp. MCBD17_040]